jgi:hypothetical protein
MNSLIARISELIFGRSTRMKELRVAADVRKSDRERQAEKRKRNDMR